MNGNSLSGVTADGSGDEECLYSDPKTTKTRC